MSATRQGENPIKTLGQLIATLPQIGRVEWLGLRPERGAPMLVVHRVDADPRQGLTGDRYSGKSGERQVTLIQAEHIPVIASCLGLPEVAPELLRRNIAVSGINLLALKHRRIRVGDVELETTGLCQPCSRMEQLLGPGGYNAVRGHGGITARVLTAGTVTLGDPVRVL
jgi:MOSC domain-containing protein YiiM